MLDKPDKNGIYPTSECYQKLYKFVCEQKNKARNEIINELESNPNEDGSESPNLAHWIEQKQIQLRKLLK